jgi:toxin CcdB
MARFDVYEGAGTYLLDCQADILDHLETRFVVPLFPADNVPRANRLNPLLNVAGRPFVMATQLASAMPARELREPVDSLADEHDVIIGAFDMLITGY